MNEKPIVTAVRKALLQIALSYGEKMTRLKSLLARRERWIWRNFDVFKPKNIGPFYDESEAKAEAPTDGDARWRLIHMPRGFDYSPIPFRCAQSA